MNSDCEQKFEELVSNAFEFLNKSVAEFDTDIKFSIIHFCIAVENILKAELLHEHWSLIFKKPENAKWEDFVAGDFQSVSLEEAITRLKNISRKEILKEAKESFATIVKERNKIIHFYNGNISKESIAKHQFSAWFYIDNFLQTWDHFHKFLSEKENFREIMAGQRGYLQLRYERIKPALAELDRTKFLVEQCPRCHYEAFVIHNTELEPQDGKCRVCDFIAQGFTITCPDCGKLLLVTDVHTTSCDCHPDIDRHKLIKMIEKKLSYHADLQQGEGIYWLANCTECGGDHTAIKLADDQWMCMQCFSLFDKASRCDWCKELYTGEDKDTYIFGCDCNLCEGYIGNITED